MEKAINETNRRRNIQQEYNEKNKIIPQPIIKKSTNSILEFLDISRRLNSQQLEQVYQEIDNISLDNIPDLIKQFETQMQESAKNLEFEKAAEYRDKIKHLRDKLLSRHE